MKTLKRETEDLWLKLPETLSDGSVVWNIHIRGGEIACVNEKAADKAADLLAEALTVAAGERQKEEA
jgi:hypothetical protein